VPRKQSVAAFLSISSPFLVLDVAAMISVDIGVLFLALFDEGGIGRARILGANSPRSILGPR
jgi:hypothetical protein